MGYLRDIYGKRSNEFVRGVLAGIQFCSDHFTCTGYLLSDVDLKAIISAESPEEFSDVVEQIYERGYA